MTITTKYDVGDEVWFMYGNRPMQLIIDVIETKNFLSLKERIVIYKCDGLFSLKEHEIFSTKEELLKSL